MVDTSIELDAGTAQDKQYARQLFVLTVLWLVLVLGAGALMVFFI